MIFEDPDYRNSVTPPKVAYLSSIIKGVTSDKKLAISRFALVADDTKPDGQPLSDVLKNAEDYLAIRTDVSIWDQDDGEHEFDFKYDETPMCSVPVLRSFKTKGDCQNGKEVDCGCD